MTRGDLLAKNSLIIGLGRIITSFVSFIALPFYVKALSADGFGLVDAIVAYVAIANPLVSARVELSIFRWLVDARGLFGKRQQVISTATGILCKSVFFASLVYWIAAVVTGLPYAGLIYLFGITTMLFNVIVQVFRGLGDNIGYTIANIVYGVASVVIALLLLYGAKMGVEALLIGYIGGLTISIGYTAIKTKVWQYIRRDAEDTTMARRMLAYSLPMIPDQLSNLSIYTGTRAIVASILGFAANGLYALAGRFASILLSLIDVFEVAWVESATVHINAPDRDNFFSKVFNEAVVMFASAGAGILVAVAIFYDYIIDDAYIYAYYLIPALVLGYIFNGAAKICGAAFVGMKKTKIIMQTTIVSGIISVTVTILLLFLTHSVWAPAAAVVLAYIYLLLSRHIALKKVGIALRIDAPKIAVGATLFIASAALYYAPLASAFKLVGGMLLCLWAIWINRSVTKLVGSIMYGRYHREARQADGTIKSTPS